MVLHPNDLLGLLVVAFAAGAAVSDYRTGLIPNWWVGFGCLLLMAARAILSGLTRGLDQAGAALWVGALGFVACGLIPLAIYLARGLGGGDLKLLAACGAGLGPVIGLEAQLYAFGLGALFAFGRAAFDGALWQTLRGTTLFLTNPMLPRRYQKPVAERVLTPIRFGPAIGAGVIAAVALHWRG